MKTYLRTQFFIWFVCFFELYFFFIRGLIYVFFFPNSLHLLPRRDQVKVFFTVRFHQSLSVTLSARTFSLFRAGLYYFVNAWAVSKYQISPWSRNYNVLHFFAVFLLLSLLFLKFTSHTKQPFFRGSLFFVSSGRKILGVKS